MENIVTRHTKLVKRKFLFHKRIPKSVADKQSADASAEKDDAPPTQIIYSLFSTSKQSLVMKEHSATTRRDRIYIPIITLWHVETIDKTG